MFWDRLCTFVLVVGIFVGTWVVGNVHSQTPGTFIEGNVLTAAQLNAAFATKLDATAPISGGWSNGSPTVGCLAGAFPFVDPVTSKVNCGGTIYVTTGFFGATINSSAVNTLAGTIGLLTTIFVQSGGDSNVNANTSTCSVLLNAGASMVSGDFAATAPCSGGTVILTTSTFSANNGYSCYANNQTTPTNSIKPTGLLATNGVTFTATLTMGDLVTYGCLAH